MDAVGRHYVHSGYHSDTFKGRGKLQGNRAIFTNDSGSRLLIVFLKGNRLQVDSGDSEGVNGRIYGNYVRAKKPNKRK